MTGSLRWFGYESDLGVQWAVQLNESTYENAALGFSPLELGANGPVRNNRILKLGGDRPLGPRYVNAQAINSDGDTVRRRFYVGDITADIFTGAILTVAVDGLTFSITSKRGERSTVPPVTDTGITDGDIDDNYEASA